MAAPDPTPLAPRPLAQPHPSRLDPDHPAYDRIIKAHLRALESGEPGYLDPATGLYVMTAGYHAARGTCCEQGCRHCPFVV
jgi:hypothetical protein